MRGPVRSLARGAAVQRDLASRALLGPLVAFGIGTRLARRVVASSGTLLKCPGMFGDISNFFLGRGVLGHKMRDKTIKEDEGSRKSRRHQTKP